MFCWKYPFLGPLHSKSNTFLLISSSSVEITILIFAQFAPIMYLGQKYYYSREIMLINDYFVLKTVLIFLVVMKLSVLTERGFSQYLEGLGSNVEAKSKKPNFTPNVTKLIIKRNPTARIPFSL